ncbi:MAG: CDP-glycerol glycerophosphotransferase family protein [Chloroflexota bacterium]
MTQAPPAVDPKAIETFAPHWCLFWAESVKVSQFEIWLPYLRRSRYRYAIAASGDQFPASVRAHVEAMPNVTLVPAFDQMRPIFRASSAFHGFLYISTKPENFAIVNSFGGYMHVWLGHGESGKAANAFRTASVYDSVFMAHYDGVRRFPRAVRRWVGRGACAIGVPIVEGVTQDPWAFPRPVRTILYAPTWEGYRDSVDYSSVPEFVPRLVEAMPSLLADGVKVIVRPHPGTGKRRPEYRPLLDALLDAGALRGRTKAEDFAEADIMIGDVSGVVGEFLFTQKPTIMPTSARLATVIPDAKLRAEYPWVDRWPDDGLDIQGRLAALASRDPLRGARAAAARRKFRGHRSLEEAAVTFDIALAATRWRKTRIPPRYVFEAAARVPLLRRPLSWD